MIGRMSRLKLTRSGSAAAKALTAQKQPTARHRTCRIEERIRESFPDVSGRRRPRKDSTKSGEGSKSTWPRDSEAEQHEPEGVDKQPNRQSAPRSTRTSVSAW